MTPPTAPPPYALAVHAYHPEAECEYSGKVGEAVEISTADGAIQRAVISLPELRKLLRFRHRQGAKRQPDGRTAG